MVMVRKRHRIYYLHEEKKTNITIWWTMSLTTRCVLDVFLRRMSAGRGQQARFGRSVQIRHLPYQPRSPYNILRTTMTKERESSEIRVTIHFRQLRRLLPRPVPSASIQLNSSQHEQTPVNIPSHPLFITQFCLSLIQSHAAFPVIYRMPRNPPDKSHKFSGALCIGPVKTDHSEGLSDSS